LVMEPPVREGDVLSVVIDNVAFGGEGVARHEGFVLFVPFTVPGERVRCRVTEVRRGFGRAELLEVEEPSPHRVRPRCPVFYTCGGCQLQHIAYDEQLRLKRRLVFDALERIGRLRGVEVEPVVPTRPWYYRNKSAFPLAQEGGRVIAGYYAPGTHDVVDTDQCYIQHRTNNLIMREAKRLVQELGIEVYREDTRRGVIRHLVCRVSEKTAEALVTVVVTSRYFPGKDDLIRQLTEAVPDLASVYLNVNTSEDNVILGDEYLHVHGSPRIREELLGLSFELGPASFFQVNPTATELVYETVLDLVRPRRHEVVLDLYCGIGTIGLSLAGYCHRVVGVESVPPAVEDARSNAARNEVENASFLRATAEDALEDLGFRPDVVVLDPPRRGLTRRVVDALTALAPDRIFYVSCNPVTLARDLAQLCRAGYTLGPVRPVDMFPQTYHVECVVLLEKR